MALSEEVVADYQTTRLSLKAHPMAFLRPALADRGFVRACDLRDRKFRSMVQVAGVVLIRQRPGSAKGVCFITLEDETGVINLVVWPDLKEKQRRVVMGARLMEVRGRVEYDDEVIHVIAHHMTDATDALYHLSDDMLNAPVARADHVNTPLPSQVGGKKVANPRDDLASEGGDAIRPRDLIDQLPDASGAPKRGLRNAPNTRGHPRNARILPPSRDFH
jgi:error-prone DNA polymerase